MPQQPQKNGLDTVIDFFFGALFGICSVIGVIFYCGDMTRMDGKTWLVLFFAATLVCGSPAALARSFVDQHNVTLVLKGTRTLVTAPGQPFFINTTGNSGLSTGGSGDTLSGIIGALLAQGLSPLNAAKLGVWLLGHTADLVLAERGCEEGIAPTMLGAHLGAALVSLRAQAVMPAGLLERARAFL